jgi:hypothetical protein
MLGLTSSILIVITCGSFILVGVLALVAVWAILRDHAKPGR